MINFLRAVLFHIVYALSAFVFGTFSVTLYYVFPKSRAQIIINRWNFFVVFAAKTICGIKYQIDGELPDNTKRYVVMAKHQSAWETFFLQTLFEPASTILKHELLKIPFFGWGLGRLDPVAIDRANPIQALPQQHGWLWRRSRRRHGLQARRPKTRQARHPRYGHRPCRGALPRPTRR